MPKTFRNTGIIVRALLHAASARLNSRLRKQPSCSHGSDLSHADAAPVVQIISPPDGVGYMTAACVVFVVVRVSEL